MDIGYFVRSERKRSKMTQSDLAEKAGVGLNFVYQLEKNKKTIQMDRANQVLNVFGFKLGVIKTFEPWKANERDYDRTRSREEIFPNRLGVNRELED